MVEKIGKPGEPIQKPPNVLRKIGGALKAIGKAYVDCFPKKDPLLESRPPF